MASPGCSIVFEQQIYQSDGRRIARSVWTCQISERGKRTASHQRLAPARTSDQKNECPLVRLATRVSMQPDIPGISYLTFGKLAVHDEHEGHTRAVLDRERIDAELLARGCHIMSCARQLA